MTLSNQCGLGVTQNSIYNLTRKQTNIRIGHIAQPPGPPAEPLSNQVAIPGSGFTPIAFPSPGDYNIAKSGDAVHKSQPCPRSIFLSKTNRFGDFSRSGNPGPGSYHPFFIPQQQSYHLNLDQQWV
jgi:hypothetical protein